jgi:AraC-like DNA-binding protein
MFQVRAFNPHALLRHCIDSYLIVTTDEAEGNFMENSLLPHVTQSLVIGLDPPDTVYDCVRSEFCPLHFFVGPNEEVCRARFFPGLKKLIIHFKPGGLFKTFHLPARLFNKRPQNALVFLGDPLKTFSCQIKEAGISRKIEMTDDWLLGYLQAQKKVHCNIDGAIELIEQNKGNISLRELMQATYTSKRTLERHFLEQVGLLPKTFSRLVRFNEVIRFIESNLNIKWRQLADVFGYYDQSHFINEFKALTGGLPQDYLSLKARFEKVLQI